MSEKLKWAALRRAVDKVDKLTRRLANGEDVGERLAFWVSHRKAVIKDIGNLNCCAFA